MIDLEKIVGMTEEEFQKLNLEYRIMLKDGETFFGTMDLRTDRYNLEIEYGLITRVYTG